MSLSEPYREGDPIRVLLALTEQLSGPVPLDHALGAVTDAALVLVPGDHASIRLVDEAGEELVASARSGQGRTYPSLPLRKGQGIAGWVIANQRSVLLQDARTDARYVEGPQGFAVRSLTAAPLTRDGRALGVLSISSSRVGVFDERFEEVARLLANVSVPALERVRLERLAMTDDLTLAYNGRYLVARLREEIDRAKRAGHALSVAMLDLDHFKHANDTHGHAAGDRLLRVFADRTRDKTRRSDVLVRRGGEEFVLLLPSTQLEQAAVLAERVRVAVEAPIAIAPDRAAVQTVSIGVASWDGRESADLLIHRADVAMYEAKRRGRNLVVTA
jgi:diguanylate cyclase (GGDEF)-like protein